MFDKKNVRSQAEISRLNEQCELEEKMLEKERHLRKNSEDEVEVLQLEISHLRTEIESLQRVQHEENEKLERQKQKEISEVSVSLADYF